MILKKRERGKEGFIGTVPTFCFKLIEDILVDNNCLSTGLGVG